MGVAQPRLAEIAKEALVSHFILLTDSCKTLQDTDIVLHCVVSISNSTLNKYVIVISHIQNVHEKYKANIYFMGPLIKRELFTKVSDGKL